MWLSVRFGHLDSWIFLSVQFQTDEQVHFPHELIPISLLRLVSNSAATGLMLDLFKEQGPDSPLGIGASLLLSSTETVFYCFSLYFGSLGIRKTRYAMAGALFATAVGIFVSVWMSGRMA